MQTSLGTRVIATAEGKRADAILRTCVHCGFCNATCPTYQITGDELDGPRGRIYLIKDVLEQELVSPVARRHLDRCLTCRACETTCPSGVAYGELLEIGRDYIERNVAVEAPRRRPLWDRLIRAWLIHVLPVRKRFRAWAQLGHALRWALPRRLAQVIPVPQPAGEWPSQPSVRRVILLEGCVQAVATPQVNRALARILAVAGIEAIRAGGEGCCGGLALHLGATDLARRHMVRNVTGLMRVAADAEAIVSTASGCGVTVKDYARLLAGSPDEAAARTVAEKTRDAAEYLLDIADRLPPARSPLRIAFHSPCTLQHGQGVRGAVETLLRGVGHTLVAVRDAHLCCGSAGTYSILQPALSEDLRARKVADLMVDQPDVIVTANVGCALHLAKAAPVPVRHWLELLD